jgi:lysozyme family protein
LALFDDAVREVLINEGGAKLVKDPDDPGGTTRYGISKRAHPDVDIEHLSEVDARLIYYYEYWLRYGVHRIFDQTIATKVLDMAVLMGGSQATRCLQRAIRAVGRIVDEDGVLGPQTASAANDSEQHALLAALRSECAGRLRRIASRRPQSEKYEKGWLRRAYS